jgi:predicted nucleic acid-binding protein
MILVDTGPIVALFDPCDDAHAETKRRMATIHEPLVSTIPVLTEVFHLLDPGSRGAEALQEFIRLRGMALWFLDGTSLSRAFALMKKYADHPMDLAAASLVAASEALRTTTVFTLDRRDFATYRATFGRSSRAFTVIG